MVDVTRTGARLTWPWTGADAPLQTHTAGLRDYQVQARRRQRARGHVRQPTDDDLATVAVHAGALVRPPVRATDRAGNVGPWSKELRIWVP